jgi:uncharacterized membrane protein
MKKINKIRILSMIAPLMFLVFSGGAFATTAVAVATIVASSAHHVGRVSIYNGTSGNECKGVIVQRPNAGTTEGSFSVNLSQCTPVSTNKYRLRIEAQGALPAINDTKYIYITESVAGRCVFTVDFSSNTYHLHVATPDSCQIS